MITAAGACQNRSSSFPSGITLEEQLLSGPPNSDTGAFQPKNAAQEEVLSRHKDLRGRVWERTVDTVEGLPAVSSSGSGRSLTAVLRTSEENPPRQVVDVRDDDQVIFTTDAGLPSPALPVQGLWSYEDHWALEILLADQEIWKGKLYLDGELLNQSRNYQEAFGFQLLNGKPFYFYQKGNQLGFSYTGQETDLPYDQIEHYNCCSASTLNPIQAEELAAFFARKGEDWFYVELGRLTN